MPDLFHPINIAIDGNEANCVHRVGSNAYAFEMIKALAEITQTKRKNFHLTILLAAPPVADLPSPRLGLQYKVIGPPKLWTQFALPKYLFFHQHQYDLFYTPGHYAPRFSPIPYISSVMDLAFLTYPNQFRRHDLYQLTNWTRYSVKKAAKIATISKFSRQEICRFYHRQQEDVLLAYPAFAGKVIHLDSAQQIKILKNLKINHPFFLYLGTLQPRKNILRLIEAFETFTDKLQQIKNAPPINLVLAGKNGWLTNEIIEKINQSPAAKKIILTGFITEEQKATLLGKALGTFNLGFYEGFGIPALESLAYNTIPVVANNTSLPEVIGSCGLKIDPFDVQAITTSMLQLSVLNQKQKNILLKNAPLQINKFSYQKSANQILTALLRLYKEK